MPRAGALAPWRARLTLCGMADIAIRYAEGAYDVVVDGTSQHRVGVPARLDDEGLGRVVRVSLEFLLEREPAASIVPVFSLDVIGRSFPEYEAELPRRLG
jgi:hypothetical protein